MVLTLSGGPGRGRGLQDGAQDRAQTYTLSLHTVLFRSA